jgi:lipid-A-disaccharide synthase
VRKEDQPQSQKLIYLIAGEESGDQIGASLMQALRAKQDTIRFEGIGGTRMAAQGLNALFSMRELSIMGFLEVIPHIPNVLARLSQTVEDIKKLQPAVVITIDAPGFNFRLAKKLKRLNIPVIHFTAPTVWAWRPRRAERIAQYVTHLLTLFPFEPPYFTKHGLKTTFVGHPLIEKKLDAIQVDDFYKKYNLKKTQQILCVLPGSRLSELNRHLTTFFDTIELLKANHADLAVVIPTLENHKDKIQLYAKKRGVHAIVVTEEQERFQAMRVATTALAASGTVTLELGLCETPMVVAYQANPITAAIVRRMLLTKYVSLVNILLEAEVVPELLQENCTAEGLSLHLNKLLERKSEAYQMQKKALKNLRKLIEVEGGIKPSEAAAEIIWQIVNKPS